MSEEADVIEHLMEVERNAARMMDAAQVQANQRLSEARAQADARFKEEYAKITAALDAAEAEERAAIVSGHESQLSAYKEALRGSPKDPEAFTALFESLLYA